MVGRGVAAGLALAALALTVAGCGGTTTTVTVIRTHTVTTTHTVTKTTAATAAPCTGNQLSGTFALVPGSSGAGHIEYVLTLTNTSQGSCSVSGVPKAVLLGTGGSALPTQVVSGSGVTGQKIVLAPGASAKAAARFSPDVPGTGDKQTGKCQPTAYTLQVTLKGSTTTDAPMQPPTSVCEQGQLQFQPYSSG